MNIMTTLLQKNLFAAVVFLDYTRMFYLVFF